MCMNISKGACVDSRNIYMRETAENVGPECLVGEIRRVNLWL